MHLQVPLGPRLYRSADAAEVRPTHSCEEPLLEGHPGAQTKCPVSQDLQAGHSEPGAP